MWQMSWSPLSSSSCDLLDARRTLRKVGSSSTSYSSLVIQSNLLVDIEKTLRALEKSSTEVLGPQNMVAISHLFLAHLLRRVNEKVCLAPFPVSRILSLPFLSFSLFSFSFLFSECLLFLPFLSFFFTNCSFFSSIAPAPVLSFLPRPKRSFRDLLDFSQLQSTSTTACGTPSARSTVDDTLSPKSLLGSKSQSLRSYWL